MNVNKLFYVLVAGIVVLVLITSVLILRGVGGGSVKRVKLEFWGVFDEKGAFEKIIADYRNLNPGIDVNYRVMPFESYERDLVDALAAGTNPDIVMIHNTWLPKHKDKLESAPEKISQEKEPFFTIKNYREQFVEVAYKDLVSEDKIYGFPLYVDTLALFYNRDLFNAAGLTKPPETWEEFNKYTQVLTKLDSEGRIIKSGTALGTAKNINRSTDILMALMLQSGVVMTNTINTNATFARPVNGERLGDIALEYYTSFANSAYSVYCWNDQKNYSIDAFVQGDVAMMFNYSHQIPIIKNKAARLNFAVAPLPQPDPGDPRNYANYWGAAVVKKARDTEEAWKFLRFLTSRSPSIDYLNATLRPAARRDVIELQKNDLDFGLFALQALTAKSWYQVDNKAIESIFAEMIDNVNFNRLQVRDAIRNAESRVNVLMSSLNVE